MFTIEHKTFRISRLCFFFLYHGYEVEFRPSLQWTGCRLLVQHEAPRCSVEIQWNLQSLNRTGKILITDIAGSFSEFCDVWAEAANWVRVFRSTGSLRLSSDSTVCFTDDKSACVDRGTTHHYGTEH